MPLPRRPLKHIRQKGRTECGLACIAMLAGIGLARARNAVGSLPNTRNDRVRANHIRKALAGFGIRLGREVHETDWRALRERVDLALLAVNYDGDRDCWHWIVFDSSEPDRPVLDPRSRERRAVTTRTRLCSYYRVVLEPA